MRITGPNVLSWYSVGNDTSAYPIAFDNCRSGSLITFPGDSYRFYLNLRVPAVFQGPTIANLVTFTNPETVITGISSSISVDVIRAGHATVYGELVCPNVPPGLYRWKLQYIDEVIYSSVIEVATPDVTRLNSILLEYRNSATLHAIRYPWLADETFRQRFRVRATLISTPPQTESTSYREVSTGIVRPYNTSSDWVLTFKTLYTDIDILQGLFVMLHHDTLLINGKPVTVKDHLTIQDGRGNLKTGQFSVYDNTFSTPLVP